MHLTELLLEHGANVDVAPPRGHTALYDAVKRADRDIIQPRLNYGRNMNEKTCGEKPFPTLASKNGQNCFVQLLLEAHTGTEKS